jgi:membrane protein DedA with SNARE-associated domain
MNALFATAHPWLAQYGYGALFAVLFGESFGLPFPGETFLVASSFLASQVQMRIVWIAAVAIVAAVLGDNVGYGIGRWGGQRLTVRYGARLGITPERLAKTARFFARFGPEIVIVARFIPVLRQLNGVAAGAAQMSWKRFLVYNALGAALWVGTWTAAVFLVGEKEETFRAGWRYTGQGSRSKECGHGHRLNLLPTDSGTSEAATDGKSKCRTENSSSATPAGYTHRRARELWTSRSAANAIFPSWVVDDASARAI